MSSHDAAASYSQWQLSVFRMSCVTSCCNDSIEPARPPVHSAGSTIESAALAHTAFQALVHNRQVANACAASLPEAMVYMRRSLLQHALSTSLVMSTLYQTLLCHLVLVVLCRQSACAHVWTMDFLSVLIKRCAEHVGNRLTMPHLTRMYEMTISIEPCL